MAINKVVYGDDTLIDLTSDTVTSSTLAEGVTAHDKAGNAIVGTGVISETPTLYYKNMSTDGLKFTNESYIIELEHGGDQYRIPIFGLGYNGYLNITLEGNNTVTATYGSSTVVMVTATAILATYGFRIVDIFYLDGQTIGIIYNWRTATNKISNTVIRIINVSENSVTISGARTLFGASVISNASTAGSMYSASLFPLDNRNGYNWELGITYLRDHVTAQNVTTSRVAYHGHLATYMSTSACRIIMTTVASSGLTTAGSCRVDTGANVQWYNSPFGKAVLGQSTSAGVVTKTPYYPVPSSNTQGQIRAGFINGNPNDEYANSTTLVGILDTGEYVSVGEMSFTHQLVKNVSWDETITEVDVRRSWFDAWQSDVTFNITINPTLPDKTKNYGLQVRPSINGYYFGAHDFEVTGNDVISLSVGLPVAYVNFDRKNLISIDILQKQISTEPSISKVNYSVDCEGDSMDADIYITDTKVNVTAGNTTSKLLKTFSMVSDLNVLFMDATFLFMSKGNLLIDMFNQVASQIYFDTSDMDYKVKRIGSFDVEEVQDNPSYIGKYPFPQGTYSNLFYKIGESYI